MSSEAELFRKEVKKLFEIELADQLSIVLGLDLINKFTKTGNQLLINLDEKTTAEITINLLEF